MPVSGLCHYNLRADRASIEALCEFYCSVVGLAVGPRPAFRSMGYWLYAGAKDVLHLTVAASGEDRRIAPQPIFDHVAFACSDPAAYRRELVANGIDFQASTVPGTGQVQFFFRDPAGNGVELNFPPE